MSELLISVKDFKAYQDKLCKVLRFKNIYFDKLIRETPKAYLVLKGENQYWIPKSITYNLDLSEEPYNVYVQDWFDLESSKIIQGKTL